MTLGWIEKLAKKTKENVDAASHALANYSFSWPTLLILIGLLTLYTATSDAGKSASASLEWLYLAILIHSLFAAEAVLIGLFLRRLNGSFTLTIASVIAYTFLGALRGVSIGAFALWFGLVTEVDWIYRTVGGATITLINAVLITLAVADNQDFRLRRQLLEDAEVELREGSIELQAKLEKKKAEVLETLNRQIQLAIEGVGLQNRGSLSKKPESLVKSLMYVAEEIVRPISRTFSVELFEEQKFPTRVQGKILIAETLKSAARSMPFQPVVITVVWSIIGLLNLRTIGISTETVASTMSFAGWLFCSLLALKLSLQPLLHKLSTVAISVIVVFAYLLVSVLAGVIAYLPVANYQSNNFVNLQQTLLYQLPLQIAFSLVLVALIAGLRKQRSEALVRLESVNTSLKRRLARKQAFLRTLEQNLRSEVHAKVQGSLIAVALKLQKAIEDGEADYELRERLAEILSESSVVSGIYERPVTLDEICSQSLDRWDDVLEISFQIQPELRARISDDWVLLRTLDILIRDSVNNSIKHSDASRIVFKLRLQDYNAVIFEAEDNGGSTSGDFVPGEGFRFIEQVSIHFSAKTSASGFRVSALLPISSPPKAAKKGSLAPQP